MGEIQHDKGMGGRCSRSAPLKARHEAQTGSDTGLQEMSACRSKNRWPGFHVQKSTVADSLNVRGVPVVAQPPSTPAQ
ncbi:hypothetical protein PDO_4032 [Rhizobium sp. PDO1-076]|nr:hypothetical protein PDO_4032 [Rhizobium sp. PDO1-076]